MENKTRDEELGQTITAFGMNGKGFCRKSADAIKNVTVLTYQLAEPERGAKW